MQYLNANQPSTAREHFYGLMEAKPDLVGVAIFDRLSKSLDADRPLCELMWRRREIENYLCHERVLLAFAAERQHNDLLDEQERHRRVESMRRAIRAISDARETLGQPGPESPDIKASDEFLDPLFARYSKDLGVPLVLRKSDYHLLVRHINPQEVDADVVAVLDRLVAVAQRAQPSQPVADDGTPGTS